MNTTLRLSAIALAAALTACGGGGGGSSSSSSSPVAATSAPSAPAPVVKQVTGPTDIKLVGLSIKPTDIIVQTAPTGTVTAAITGALTKLIPSAYADNTTFNPGANIGFTYKLVNGKLVSLQPKFKDKSGKDLACSDSTAEIVIHRGWLANKNKGHMLAKMKVPTSIDASCNVQAYADATFVLAADGTATDVSVSGDEVVSVIEAGDEAFNISSNSVLIYASGMVRELSVDDAGVSTLSDLSTSTLPLALSLGTLAYDGKTLLAVPKGTTYGGTIALEKGKQGFKILPWGSTWYVNIGFGLNNQFVARSYEQRGKLFDVNVVTGDYTPTVNPYAEPIGIENSLVGQVAGTNTPSAISTQPWGFNGRSGDWFMARDCLVFNMRTADWVVPQLLDAPTDKLVGGGYARLAGGKATCQGGNSGQRFTQYDVNTKQRVTFDLFKLGFFPKGIVQDDVYAYGDTLMVRIVDSVTGDLRFVELNFTTGQAADRGLIQSGTRQVSKLVPIGG